MKNKQQNNNKPNQDEVVDMMQLQKSLLNIITCFFGVCVAIAVVVVVAIAIKKKSFLECPSY